MSLSEQLKYYIDNPSTPVDPDWVDSVAREFPFFTLPATLLLSRDTAGVDPERIKAIAQRLTLNSPDPMAIIEVVNPDAAKWISLYPDQNVSPKVSTDEAIDKFIGTYGNPEPDETATLERLIFNPTPDYAQILAQEEEMSQPQVGEAEAGSQDERINNFIIKSRNNQGHFPSPDQPTSPQQTPQKADDKPVESPDQSDNSLLSESLAKVYLSQRRYDKAYEIILSLSLNYPEKSIYFADQLRFLRKVIANQRIVDQKSAKH